MKLHPWKCPKCGLYLPRALAPIRCLCGLTDPTGDGLMEVCDAAAEANRHAERAEHGPGEELHALLESIDIYPNQEQTCPCLVRARIMNVWGVDGCRNHFSLIVSWLEKDKDNYGWTTQLKAAANAVKTGLAFKINWLDPFPDLIDEAIRRAEVKEHRINAASA